MAASRQLRLGAFMRPATIHTGAWRYPGAFPDANFNFAHLKRFAQTLERGKFDAFFMADHLAVLNMPLDALKRSHTVTSFEPFTLLSALAGVTEHLGLVATGSTTFDAPYHVARRFASLDHISGGRAGWNIVTTSNPDAALNFGLDDHMEHAERYARAREFYDVVTGFGIAGRTTPSSATPIADFISIPTSCMCSITRANTSPCAVRSTSLARSKVGRSSSKPGHPRPAANSRRKRRKPCSRPKRISPPGARSTPTSKPAPKRPGVAAIT